jgi:septal ring factor EnvC (AmiA/AmiB activator)
MVSGDTGEVGAEFTIGSGSGVVTTTIIGADPHLSDKGRALRLLQQKAEELSGNLARTGEEEAALRREAAQVEHDMARADEAVRLASAEADKLSRRLRDVKARHRTAREGLERMERERLQISDKISAAKATLGT